MKKVLLNMKTLGLMAIVAGALTLNSCNTVKCNEPRDDNYESTQNQCNESATTGKFVRSNVTMLINGSASNGTYLVTIQEGSEDYTLDLITNWGLTTSGGGNVSPVSHACTVSKNTATIAQTNIAGGTASGTITYNPSNNKISITVTLSGFGSNIDGTSNDSQQ